MVYKIQFSANKNEYEKLKENANIKGVSISQYVKSIVFPEKDSFEKLWTEFLEKLAKYPTDVPFNVAYVMTEERWRTFDRSTKLSIARLFNKKVMEGEFDGIVKFIGRSSGNVSTYKKIS